MSWGDPSSGPYESVNSDTSIAKSVDIEAAFRGGHSGFIQYISDNFNYPPRCMDEGISGTVRLRFIVEIDGRITNIKVVDSTSGCPEFSQEAIRVLKSSPRWIPAQYKGKFVKAWRELPISLRLD